VRSNSAVELAPPAAPAPISVWDQVAERASQGDYRPTLRPDLTWARMKTRHGLPNIMLADRPRKYLRLSPRDDQLAQLMDGSRRVSDLVVEYFRRFGSFGFRQVTDLVTLLRQAGVAAELKAPWLDEAPEADEASDIVIPAEPGESVLGCRFLKALLDEPEVMVEPEKGNVRLATREARITLAGGVLRELFRYLEEGAEILSAKLLLGPIALRFDALTYRLQSVKLEPVKAEHWTLELDQRLEQIAAVWEQLDAKYAALRDRLAGGSDAVPAEPAQQPGGAAAVPAAQAGTTPAPSPGGADRARPPLKFPGPRR